MDATGAGAAWIGSEAVNRRATSRIDDKAPETASPLSLQGPVRLAVRRVRLRSVARVGFSIGWIISFLPALIASVLGAWALRGTWNTLDAWAPWQPWAPGTRIAGVTLPTPEFRPREALHLEALYEMLAPIGRHPVLGAVLGTLALTVLGGLLVAAMMLLAAIGYNLFSGFTGGLEFELAPRPVRRPRSGAAPRAARPGRRTAGDGSGWDEDTDLQW